MGNSAQNIHVQLNVNENSALLTDLYQNADFLDLSNKYQLERKQITLNIYKGLSEKVLVIPITGASEKEAKFIAVYYDQYTEVENIKVMKINLADDQFRLSFSNYSETQTVTGVFKEGEYVDTISESTEDVSAQNIQRLRTCLQEGYENLPVAMRAVCAVSCSALWTGIGIAACAGCLVGLGINCD